MSRCEICAGIDYPEELEAKDAELTALRERVAALEAEQAFSPRAAKLMRKRKNFIVVAEDEPYFDVVYTAIRAHEKEEGRWTEEDEQLWREGLRRAAALLKELDK